VSTPHLEAIGGTLYITTIMSQVPTAAGVPYYAGIVREKALRRRMIAAADRMMTAAYQSDNKFTDVLASGEASILALNDETHSGKFDRLPASYQLVSEAMERRKLADAQGEQTGYITGLAHLNGILEPLNPTDGPIVIIGAPSSTGKSLLGMQFAVDFASQDAKCLVVSMEMGEDSVARRLVRYYTGLNFHTGDSIKWRSAHPETVYPKWEAALEQIQWLPLIVKETPPITPSELVLLGRRAKRKLGGLDFIVVDYLQLMDDDDHTVDETPRVAAISRSFRRIGKTLKCGIVAISSFNRESLSSAGRRPSMARLKASSQIEFDADVVMLLHRPDREDKTNVELIIDKQRNGATGIVRLRLDEQTLRWHDDVSQE
jgi:replicative DNA helicase